MTDDAFTDNPELAGDMFDDGPGAGAFALPSDSLHVAIKEAKANGEPLPTTTPAEPEVEPDGDYGAADPSDALDLSSVYAKFGIDPETATEKELTLARSYREVELLQARQANELGEWRAFAATDDVSDDEESEPHADDPAAAMAAALEYGGVEGLQEAFEIWQGNDPVAAANWLANERVAATEMHYAAKYAEQEERLQQAAQVQDAFAEVGRTTAIEAQRAREEAFVASASFASSGGHKLSKADQIAADWDEINAPHEDGWQV